MSTSIALRYDIQNTTNHDRIVDTFLAGRSETTRRAYAADMVHFAGYLRVADTNEAAQLFLTCGPARGNAIALDYRNAMWEKKLQGATINRRLSTLRSLLKVARMTGLVNWELAVENVKHRSYRDTRGPRESGFRRLQTKAESRTDAKGIRDTAILYLLHDLALRRSEVCSLDVADLDLENSTIAVLGKGNTQKTMLSLPKRTAEALRTWVETRGSQPGPLFTNMHRSESIAGTRLTGTSLYRIVRRLGSDVGLTVRPHGLRHTAISTACERASEAGITDLSKILHFSRHANLKTLQIYIDAHEDFQGRIAEVVAR